MSLLISEYVEGTGSNRALELYNSGKSSINLQGYEIDVYFDGASTVGKTVALTGTILAGTTFVVAEAGFDTAVSTDLTTSGTFFDGNDAIVLKKGGAISDSIGQIGVDPGAEWSAGVTGWQSTADNTLRRMLDVKTGDKNPNDVFDPGQQWNGFGTDVVAGLGTHSVVPTTAQPSEEEQLILELVNLARANPLAHMKDLFDAGDPGIDTAVSYFGVQRSVAENQVKGLGPLAPLAWDAKLAKSAETHNNLSMQYDMQGHDLPDEATIAARFSNVGYDWNNVAENTYSYAIDPLYAHAGFYIDWGPTATGIQNPAGHRDTILNPVLRDIGIAYESHNGSKTGPNVVTQHFGEPGDLTTPFTLVGVVIDDKDNDDFYDIGEGKGGISISAADAAGSVIASTSTWGSGGYSLSLPAGKYDVTFSGAGLGANQTFAVTMGSKNQALNVEVGAPAKPATTVAEIHSDISFGGVIASYDDFDSAFAVVSPGQSIDIVNDSAVGNVGSQTVTAESISIRGGSLFDGKFTLGAGINNFDLDGATNAGITGNNLDNLLFGSDGDNVISGLGGTDDISGGSGNDSLDGGSGNDVLRGGPGDDTHLGGTGDDIYVVGDPGDVISESTGEGTDTVLTKADFTLPSEVEALFAISGAKGLSLTGNTQSNVITGANGDDNLGGKNGNDTLTGRGGDDSIDSGSGDDEINGWGGNDTLIGGDGDDLIRGADGDDFLSGGNGSDRLWSMNGNDTLDGGDGDDAFYVRNSSATVVEASGGGRDVIYTTVDFKAGIGQEIEVIRAATDTNIDITGNAFDNYLKGGAGANGIDGGRGNDLLFGGAGSDEFRFGTNWGFDIIQDFVDGADVLNMTGSGVTALSQLTISQNGQDTQIEAASGDTIVLQKTTATSISANDFVFDSFSSS